MDMTVNVKYAKKGFLTRCAYQLASEACTSGISAVVDLGTLLHAASKLVSATSKKALFCVFNIDCHIHIAIWR